MSQKTPAAGNRSRIKLTVVDKTDGMQKETELPLRVLMFGDLTPGQTKAPLRERQPVSVSKADFDEKMKAQGLAATVAVANHLTEGEETPSEQLAVSLKFAGLADFTPEGVAAQVPEMAELLKLRAALVALKAPLIDDRRGFKRRLDEMIRDEETRRRVLAEAGLADAKDGE